MQDPPSIVNQLGVLASHGAIILLEGNAIDAFERTYRSGNMADMALDHQSGRSGSCCISEPPK